MSNLFKLLFLLVFFPLLLQGQFYKEHCISGNCRNGFGLNRVSTSIDPLNKSYSGQGSYYYYELGYFTKGKLNGRGCKFETLWNYGNFKPYDDKIEILMNENQLLKPDSSWMLWHQSGNYQNGLLEGAGLLIEWNVKEITDKVFNSYTLVKKTCSGNFHLGKLHGTGFLTIEQPLSYQFDTTTHKYSSRTMIPTKIYAGRFDNWECVDCTESVLSYSGIWGETKGKNLNQSFYTGWVVKNYENLSKSLKNSPQMVFRTTMPYRVLLIGGIEVGQKTSAVNLENKKIQLSNGIEYYGEVDAEGKPFGFGILNGPEYYYEGLVDQGLPQGTGLYKSKNPYASSISIGGDFNRGNLLSGASYDHSRNKLIISNWGGNESSINLINGSIVNGNFTEYQYAYDVTLNNYKLIRQESGYANNGKMLNSQVNIGLTDADKKRQRKMVNGSVKFDEIVVGDVVVIEGLASVVEKATTSAIDLLDQRRITNNMGSTMIQLSSHKLNEFKRTCSLCNGIPIKKYMYTAPPQEVSYTYYKTETIISEYSTQTLRFPQTGTYTKKFEPVERTSYCNQCNTTGTEILKRQIKE